MENSAGYRSNIYSTINVPINNGYNVTNRRAANRIPTLIGGTYGIGHKLTCFNEERVELEEGAFLQAKRELAGDTAVAAIM